MQRIKNIASIAGRLLLAGLVCFGQSSCKKFLDQRRSQDLAVPSSLKDLQALLNSSNNYASAPGYSEFLTDNMYVTTASWTAAQLKSDRDLYIWDKDAKISSTAWINPYSVINYMNVVLDFLPKVEVSPTDKSWHDNIQGTALFFRAFMHYELAQLFCNPYSASANTDPGIVLRTTSSVTTPGVRATVKQTYDQIIADLKTAVELLPGTNSPVTRPNKSAAYGFLARVYLSMRDYTNAQLNADAALALNNTLLDYNSLTPSTQPLLPVFSSNPEIQFMAYEAYGPAGLVDIPHCKIDSNLYRSYQDNDLRKKVFFRTDGTSYYWYGSYFTLFQNRGFNGIVNDEIYLIRAECRARTGNKDGALNDLNTLLRKRWITSSFTDLTASTPEESLGLVLTERRKELVFRSVRWSDLRRFNLEGSNITLTRIINGNTYTLPPSDLRWTLLIPDIEVNRSGIPQNPR